MVSNVINFYLLNPILLLFSTFGYFYNSATSSCSNAYARYVTSSNGAGFGANTNLKAASESACATSCVAALAIGKFYSVGSTSSLAYLMKVAN